MRNRNAPLQVLIWHVHGSWLNSFVRGRHQYLLPTLPEGGPWGGGRCGRDWPDAVREVPAGELAATPVDVVVLQRPEELELARKWLGRTPGVHVPAVYVEHNTPRGDIPDTEHPLVGRRDIRLVHVTHFNRLMWNSGAAPTAVIEHGVVDPGPRYTGELPRAAVVVNEPVRRWRVTGTDLLPRLAGEIGLDAFGMGLDGLGNAVGLDGEALRPIGDLPAPRLHEEMARRRVYLHPVRWTSLGLSLIEAMHLGMPVVALDTTEAARAVPPDAGVVSSDLDEIGAALRELSADRAKAGRLGTKAREYALCRYGLARFLSEWDDLLYHVACEEVACWEEVYR